jgi:DNA-directed RNA polymerase specialized sigma24 family protein
MSIDGSVSRWLSRLKAGESSAARPLWESYFQRLVRLARRHLKGLATPAADEEDVALSAFHSFCRGAEAGRFPRLDDRDDLWQVLMVLTTRKTINLLKHEHRQKRGGGRVRHVSGLEHTEADAFADILADEPTPELAAQVAEECRRLLDLLGNEELRTLAVAKMEGYTNAEIATQVGKSVATVERKLQLIRKTWEAEIQV